LGISDAQIADNHVLMCQARALSDVEVDIQTVAPAGELAVKRLPCRIERCELLCPDVMGVHLRLPVAEEFCFQAGQYIDVLLPGARRRSFSIASPPQGTHHLELHVRLVPGGEFTTTLFENPQQRQLLTIEGPLGQFVYRESAAPMLLIGGGTGFAPLNSIIRHVIDLKLKRTMTLYWGCRTEQDLYAHSQILALAQAHPVLLRYVPVLSAGSMQWTGEHGLVHEAVLRGVADLAKYDIYAAGPPAMIAAIRAGFSAAGAASERLYFDSFDYAPDSVERQRNTALSNS
jgi:CDP-4-dehydro-6-deoxyglucose reductase